MFRRIARMTAVVGALAVLGATSASAMDDDQVRSPSPGPVWVDSGVYGYDSTSGDWVVWDLYRLPNGQRQRLCHAAGKSGPKTAC
jgi:hypothetical protein